MKLNELGCQAMTGQSCRLKGVCLGNCLFVHVVTRAEGGIIRPFEAQADNRADKMTKTTQRRTKVFFMIDPQVKAVRI